MTPASDDLRQLLTDAVAWRLAPQGWRILPTFEHRDSVAVFARPIESDFLVTAVVSSQPRNGGSVFFGSRSGTRPVVIQDVRVGLSYESLRRLFPLIGRFQYSVISASDAAFDPDTWDPIYWGDEDDDDDDYSRDDDLDDADEDDDDPEDDDNDGPDSPLTITTRDQVAAVADQIAELVVAGAVPLQAQIWTVDELLKCLAPDVREERDIRRAAVLAAAGRYPAAATALDRLRLQPGRSRRPDRRLGRSARQLRRWIDSSGDPRLLPSKPPPAKRSAESQRSYREVRERSKLRDEAKNQVREARDGKSRDELREMLLQAFEQRGLTENAIKVEFMVDQIGDSTADQISRAVGAATKIGRGIFKLIRTKEFPDLEPPAWLEPPDRAAYEFPTGDDWITVDLSDKDCDWLDGVMREIPSMLSAFGIWGPPAWLRWTPEPREPNSVLRLHLGERAVGSLGRAAAVAMSPIMAAAAFRDELPVVRAQLARRSRTDDESRYILVFAAPATKL